jgi:uracil-DNA glycosylase family 4
MAITNTSQMKEALRDQAAHNGLTIRCLPDGAFHATIAVVSEFPTEREQEMLRPLIGGAGQALWKEFQKLGLSRNDIYITHACKRTVSFGKDKSKPIDRNEVSHWTNMLRWELSQLPNLQYILILGDLALQGLTNNKGIDAWRGSVLDVAIGKRTVPAVVTYPPVRLLHEPKKELPFKFDLGKFKRVINDDWKVQPVTCNINLTYVQAEEYLHELRKQGGPVAYDIEVINNETACIGFANSGNEGTCISFRGMTSNTYNIEEEVKLRRLIYKTLQAPEIKLIAQNGMFDGTWLWYKDRIKPGNHFFDTMLAHHCLYPTLPHGLGYLTTQYTTRPYYKDEGKDWREGGDIDQFWRYNAQDCANTFEAYRAMERELVDAKLDDFFYSHIMKAQPHLMRMCVTGLKIDTEYNNELKDIVGSKVTKYLEIFQQAVAEATGEDDLEINPNSPKQLSELLFRKLKLVGRGPSTDTANRERMYQHVATTEPKRKVLRALDDYAIENKFYSTYVKTAYDDDGRMRCTYNQTGVQSAPGRLSSSGMLWKNEAGEQTGGNLQNQPERAYDKFVADDGYGFGYFDLSQAEARAVAWYGNIESWIEQFERARIDRSYDAHRALASDMFGIEYDNVPVYDRDENGVVTVRYIAKRCRHGLNYRMQASRLAQSAGLELNDAVTYYNIYHNTTPELQCWWQDVKNEVSETKMLYNAFGRRLIFLERLTPQALESIIAFKPQSTIGDKVVQVIYQAENDPRWPTNARMALNIHDALICLAPLHKLKLCLSIMKKYAEQPIIINGREMIIPADTKISRKNERGFHSWGSLESVEVESAK